MAMHVTREEYYNYVSSLLGTMISDEGYNYFAQILDSGKNEIAYYKKINHKEINTDWIEILEASVPSLDLIIRNPRKFIVQQDDIVPVSLARKISQESIKHLAQHTNLIEDVTEDSVVPNKILNVYKEETFEIYENRFIYTLINNCAIFINKRYEKIKDELKEGDIYKLKVSSEYATEKSNYRYDLSFSSKNLELTDDEDKSSIYELDLNATETERIQRLHHIFNDFLSSEFAKQMKNTAPVRPPITRTNVILKDPNFKKALMLWQFVESYRDVGYTIKVEEATAEISEDYREDLRRAMFVEYILFSHQLQDKTSVTPGITSDYKPQFIKKITDALVENFDITDIEIKKAFNINTSKIENINADIIESVNGAIDRILAKQAALIKKYDFVGEHLYEI